MHRLRPLVALAGAASCLSVAAACSFISLEGLADGDGDGARRVDENESSVDAGEDASTGDAQEDAPPAASFCATLSPKPLFCDDFDRNDVQGAWAGLTKTGGGAISTIASTRGVNGRELLATTPAATTGASSARLERSFPAADEVSLAYALRVDSGPAEGAQQIMNLDAFASNGDRFAVYLIVQDGQISAVDQTFLASGGGEFQKHTLDPLIAMGRWQRIGMVVTYAAPPRLRVTVDGKTAFEGPMSKSFHPGTTTLNSGVHYIAAPTRAFSMHVDDLIVDVK